MFFKLNGNKVQNTEETASEITSVNGNANTKSNEDRQPKSESFRSFTEETSLHGARFLFSSNVFRRLFWTLLLMLNIGYCVYQIYESVDFYYQRPFNTKITTKTANNTTNMPFPAVTLCNLNLFNLRRFRSFQISRNMSIKEIEEKGKVYAKMLAGSKDVFNNDSKRKHEELFWRFHGKVPSFFYLNAFSHKIEDMLLPASRFDSCFIDETGCGPQNFTSFTSSTFGQCYTFNSGRDGHPVINATMAGQLNGLKLLLNIERDNYLDNPLNPFAGLAVLVHDQQTFPFMEQFGFVVQPGVRTLCSIKRKKV